MTLPRPDLPIVLLSHHGVDTMTMRPGGGSRGGGRMGGAELLALLHRFGNVVLWINGHTHINAVTPRADPDDPGRGFWEVTTCSLVDWPCQARLLELVDEDDGSLAVVCTMIDHDAPVAGWGSHPAGPWSTEQLAGLHRELAANVPWAGTDSRTAGAPTDRNVVLRLRAPFPLERADDA